LAGKVHRLVNYLAELFGVTNVLSPYVILQKNVASTDIIHMNTAPFGSMPLTCASYQLLSCLLLASYDKTGSYCIWKLFHSDTPCHCHMLGECNCLWN